MKTITAKEFYSAWLKSVEGQKQKMLELWSRTPQSNFTNLIKGGDNSIVLNVANNLKMKVYEQDYYSIDSIFYHEGDLIEKPLKGKYWFKKIRIAFEHENDFKGIMEEVAHLLIMKCDLRVLVTYPLDTPLDKLKEIKNIIQSVDQTGEILNSNGFLIICGYENQFEWQGFVYNGTDNWEQI